MKPRGCLIALLVFVAILFGVLWFALPPIAGSLATGALTTAGVHGTNTHVDVGADPPLRLLFLEADRVRVQSTDVSIQTVHADSVDLTLRDVSITKRIFGFIEGRLSGVRVTPDQGPEFAASEVQITGPAEAAHVAITIDKAAVQSLIAASVATSTGLKVSKVTLATPNRVAVVTPRGTIDGRLIVTNGELVLQPSTGSTISIVGTGAGQPVRLESVTVAGDGLEVAGVINLVQ